MRVLLYYQCPFSLAHGGLQIQIEQTRKALEKAGVDVDYLRWEDGSQTGDILHFFGRLDPGLMDLAHQKGMKVVMAELLTEQGSRPAGMLRLQALLFRAWRAALGYRGAQAFCWESYQTGDAFIALTRHEARLLESLYGAAMEKIHVVPNGVEEVFLNAGPSVRGKWLVCTATIHRRKRVLELAEAAVLAGSPVWVIGRPYSDSDPYVKRFVEFAAKNRELVRFEGPVQDREKLASIYREARGFVLLSAMESLSLSALEAAGCGCPLLLGDLPWARSAFGENAKYCPVTNDKQAAAKILKAFYGAAPGIPAPPRPLTWNDVALELKRIYERLLASTSR
jgi:glycosyltransferase involved in cell wall biosynthesis